LELEHLLYIISGVLLHLLIHMNPTQSHTDPDCMVWCPWRKRIAALVEHSKHSPNPDYPALTSRHHSLCILFQTYQWAIWNFRQPLELFWPRSIFKTHCA